MSALASASQRRCLSSKAPSGLGFHAAKHNLRKFPVVLAQSTVTTTTEVVTATSVKLSVPYRTSYGEVIKIVGSSEELGAWKPAGAQTMTWTQGDVWVANMQLPSGEYEFKLVVQNKQGARWEGGANKKLVVPEDASALEVSCFWNNPTLTTAVVAAAISSVEENTPEHSEEASPAPADEPAVMAAVQQQTEQVEEEASASPEPVTAMAATATDEVIYQDSHETSACVPAVDLTEGSTRRSACWDNGDSVENISLPFPPTLPIALTAMHSAPSTDDAHDPSNVVNGDVVAELMATPPVLPPALTPIHSSSDEHEVSDQVQPHTTHAAVEQESPAYPMDSVATDVQPTIEPVTELLDSDAPSLLKREQIQPAASNTSDHYHDDDAAATLAAEASLSLSVTEVQATQRDSHTSDDTPAAALEEVAVDSMLSVSMQIAPASESAVDVFSVTLNMNDMESLLSAAAAELDRLDMAAEHDRLDAAAGSDRLDAAAELDRLDAAAELDRLYAAAEDAAAATKADVPAAPQQDPTPNDSSTYVTASLSGAGSVTDPAVGEITAAYVNAPSPAIESVPIVDSRKLKDVIPIDDVLALAAEFEAKQGLFVTRTPVPAAGVASAEPSQPSAAAGHTLTVSAGASEGSSVSGGAQGSASSNDTRMNDDNVKSVAPEEGVETAPSFDATADLATENVVQESVTVQSVEAGATTTTTTSTASTDVSNSTHSATKTSEVQASQPGGDRLDNAANEDMQPVSLLAASTVTAEDILGGVSNTIITGIAAVQRLNRLVTVGAKATFKALRRVAGVDPRDGSGVSQLYLVDESRVQRRKIQKVRIPRQSEINMVLLRSLESVMTAEAIGDRENIAMAVVRTQYRANRLTRAKFTVSPPGYAHRPVVATAVQTTTDLATAAVVSTSPSSSSSSSSSTGTGGGTSGDATVAVVDNNASVVKDPGSTEPVFSDAAAKLKALAVQAVADEAKTQQSQQQAENGVTSSSSGDELTTYFKASQSSTPTDQDAANSSTMTTPGQDSQSSEAFILNNGSNNLLDSMLAALRLSSAGLLALAAASLIAQQGTALLPAV